MRLKLDYVQWSAWHPHLSVHFYYCYNISWLSSHQALFGSLCTTGACAQPHAGSCEGSVEPILRYQAEEIRCRCVATKSSRKWETVLTSSGKGERSVNTSGQRRLQRKWNELDLEGFRIDWREGDGNSGQHRWICKKTETSGRMKTSALCKRVYPPLVSLIVK